MKSMVDRTVEVGKTDEVWFEGKNLTGLGGIRLLRKFFARLGVEGTLRQHVQLPRRAGKYPTRRLRMCRACPAFRTSGFSKGTR